ncbi:AraC family transcriptional regulator [Lacrimispora sp. JR3]|uniref:AraC family transcriptional regulator n=1 Tax=Lacrimispora sinapis TaxID=3111456 RepID=UPI003749B366
MKKELLKLLRNSSYAASILQYYDKACGEEAVENNIVMRPGKLMDMYCQPCHIAIPEHSHNYVELVYMYSGTTVHVIGGTRKLKLETNDLLILREETRHAINPAGEEDIAFHFFLMPEFFSHPAFMGGNGNMLRQFISASLKGNTTVAEYLHFHLREILPARNLLENMIWSYVEEKEDRQEINQATMGILFMELLHDVDKVEYHDMLQYEEQIVLTAYQYLEKNYSSATLEEFSGISMQPPYYISRLFKRYYKMTFTECLQLIRLGRAANDLSSTTKPVEEIIAEVGYENSSYFHRLFKQRYGLTPKQFRDKSRSKF